MPGGLSLAGTADAIVDYETNARPIPARIREGGLLTIEGGTHIGFATFSWGPLRIFGNPDALVCRFAPKPEDPDPHPFRGLFGSAEQGLLEPDHYPTACSRGSESAIAAGLQQAITALAVRAFFDSYFAHEAGARASHAAFLTRTLPNEVAGATFAPAHPHDSAQSRR